MWVEFWDAHSNGTSKEDYEVIYVEASSQEEAELIFYNRFKHAARKISCSCCGPDYSVDSKDTLEEFILNNNLQGDIKSYYDSKTKLVIPSSDIKPEEREGSIPQQGWVWVS